MKTVITILILALSININAQINFNTADNFPVAGGPMQQRF